MIVGDASKVALYDYDVVGKNDPLGTASLTLQVCEGLRHVADPRAQRGEKGASAAKKAHLKCGGLNGNGTASDMGGSRVLTPLF